MIRSFSSIRFAVVAVVTALGAIASFTGVAAIFGGGSAGYVAAVVVSVIVFLAAVFVSSRWLGTGQVSEERPDLVSGGSKSDEVRTSGYVCGQGPYEVEAGNMQEIELDVRQGERIQGYVREVDGQDFDYYIVDERNLVAAQNGEEFNFVRSGESVAAERIRWKASRSGPWYLLLDLYGKQYDRTIRVNLRRH